VRHQGSVIIAVIAVTVMQLAITEIIQVVSMWNLLVSLGLVVTIARHGRARRGIRAGDCNNMVVVMIALWGVQMTIVQIIDVPLVPDRKVTTLLAMDMLMAGTGGLLHCSVLFPIKQEVIFLSVSSIRFVEKVNIFNLADATFL
jgi:hypothetical protein